MKSLRTTRWARTATLLSMWGLTALLLIAGCTKKESPSAPDNNPVLPLQCNAVAQMDPANGMRVLLSASASGGVAPYTFEWHVTGIPSLPQYETQNATHTYSNAGTYNVSLVVTDDDGTVCTSYRTVIATTALACGASASDSSVTTADMVTLSGQVSGGTAPYTYSWASGNGGSSNAISMSYRYTAVGTFTAQFTVTDANGQSCSKSIPITVTTPVATLTCNASATPLSGTAPLTVNFMSNVSGGQPPYTYSWAFGNGQTSTSPNPSVTYQSGDTYTVSFTARDANGVTCSKTTVVSVAPSTVGPTISAPSSVQEDVSFNVNIVYAWQGLTSNADSICIERSSGTLGTFTEVRQVARGITSYSTPLKVAGTYRFRARAKYNGGSVPIYTNYGNTISVTATAGAGTARFTNNSTYIIVSLKIDGVEQLPFSSNALAPGRYYEKNLSPGSHSFHAVYGYWDFSTRVDGYVDDGVIIISSGVTEYKFRDPTIVELLTRFRASGRWIASVIYPLGYQEFTFKENGTFIHTNINGYTVTGTYTYVNRYSDSWVVNFRAGTLSGSLYEWFGYFLMKSHPDGFSTLQYYYDGP